MANSAFYRVNVLNLSKNPEKKTPKNTLGAPAYDCYKYKLDANNEIKITASHDYKSTQSITLNTNSIDKIRALRNLGMLECTALSAKVISHIGQYLFLQLERESHGNSTYHDKVKKNIAQNLIAELEQLIPQEKAIQPDDYYQQHLFRERICYLLRKYRIKNKEATMSFFSSDGELGRKIDSSLWLAKYYSFNPYEKLTPADYGEYNIENKKFVYNSAVNNISSEKAAIAIAHVCNLKNEKQNNLKFKNRVTHFVLRFPIVLLLIIKALIWDLLVVLPGRLLMGAFLLLIGRAKDKKLSELEIKAIADTKLTIWQKLKKYLYGTFVPYSVRGEPNLYIASNNQSNNPSLQDLQKLIQAATTNLYWLDRAEVNLRYFGKKSIIFLKNMWTMIKAYVTQTIYRYIIADYEDGLSKKEKQQRIQKRHDKIKNNFEKKFTKLAEKFPGKEPIQEQIDKYLAAKINADKIYIGPSNQEYSYSYPYLLAPLWRGFNMFGEFFEKFMQENPITGTVATASYAFGVGAIVAPAKMANLLHKAGLGFLNVFIMPSNFLGYSLASGKFGAAITAGFTYAKGVALVADFDTHMEHGLKALENFPQLTVGFASAWLIGWGLCHIDFFQHELGPFKPYGEVLLGAKAGAVLVETVIHPKDSFIASTLLFPFKLLTAILRPTIGALCINIALFFTYLKRKFYDKNYGVHNRIRPSTLGFKYGWQAFKTLLAAFIAMHLALLDFVFDKVPSILFILVEGIIKIIEKTVGTVATIFDLPYRYLIGALNSKAYETHDNNASFWVKKKIIPEADINLSDKSIGFMLLFLSAAFLHFTIYTPLILFNTALIYTKNTFDYAISYLNRGLRFVLMTPNVMVRKFLGTENFEDYAKTKDKGGDSQPSSAVMAKHDRTQTRLFIEIDVTTGGIKTARKLGLDSVIQREQANSPIHP